MRQIKINLYNGRHGGRRPKSGRKRIHSKGIAHRIRENVSARTPLHINFKVKILIKNKFALRILKRAIMNARSHGLKIVHYSLQSNHVHLIVDSASNQILTKGMRSLTITFAKGLKQGRIQLERYHLHVLKSLRETKNAVRYVLLNDQKHSGKRKVVADDFSSLSLLGIDFCKLLIRKENLTLVWLGGSLQMDRGGWKIFKALSDLVKS